MKIFNLILFTVCIFMVVEHCRCNARTTSKLANGNKNFKKLSLNRQNNHRSSVNALRNQNHFGRSRPTRKQKHDYPTNKRYDKTITGKQNMAIIFPPGPGGGPPQIITQQGNPSMYPQFPGFSPNHPGYPGQIPAFGPFPFPQINRPPHQHNIMHEQKDSPELLSSEENDGLLWNKDLHQHGIIDSSEDSFGFSSEEDDGLTWNKDPNQHSMIDSGEDSSGFSSEEDEGLTWNKDTNQHSMIDSGEVSSEFSSEESGENGMYSGEAENSEDCNIVININ
ncbi:uncharacterized protein LOC123305924 [Chrysoperla carnea]|uniref:uncharacterized protein LOC123305924 n=1 Tax=Chrysoperla carnea TaxID=189513 RepID=UPI001D08F841|nr:uncharacterized protein LOC123305924 [Chrysoperla carnea]XP_044743698.1 uncharacterized protein LOC123305924 [Chrysoperla carnea]